MTTNVDFIRDLDILCFLILFFCTLSTIQTIYERERLIMVALEKDKL